MKETLKTLPDVIYEKSWDDSPFYMHTQIEEKNLLISCNVISSFVCEVFDDEVESKS